MSLTARGNASSFPSWVGKLVGVSLLPMLLVGLAEGGEKYREIAVSNGATIAGEAVFRGPPPGPYVIWVTKEADVFGEKLPDERLIVSRTGKIKNVLVTLDGIKQGKPWPDLRPQVSNQGGRFVPHLQVMRSGTKLKIVNKDPVLHNTHAVFQEETLFNLGQPLQGQTFRKRIKRPGLVELMCDSHDWMNGWVAVLDHPYYAITGEDGAYKITDIPAGTYTLTAWHEKLGLQKVRVEVKAGEQKNVNFEYPLR